MLQTIQKATSSCVTLFPRRLLVRPSAARKPKTTLRSLMDARRRPSQSCMIDKAANEPPVALGDASMNTAESSQNIYSLFATRALMASCMVYCITEYIADITICEGPSMYPTILPQGEIIFLFKYIRSMQGGSSAEKRRRMAQQQQTTFEQQTKQQDIWHEPCTSVSDIHPNLSLASKLYIALLSPLSVGDVVVVQHPLRKGNVCKRILGLPGDQVLYTHGRTQLQIVPDGHMWLEGDNPSNSSDSRVYGMVPANLILGRVVCRLWPLRGNAWMKRGGRPKESLEQRPFTGATVLPAGYDGQEIIKEGTHAHGKS